MREGYRIEPVNWEHDRDEFSKRLRQDTRFYSRDQYAKVYRPALEYWGVNSPAFIYPKGAFRFNPYPETLPTDIQGDILIAVDRESVPDPDYLKYLVKHEYWEIYIERKRGFKLQTQEALDRQLPIIERDRPAHRFATLKELEAARADEKLDAYMAWWQEFYRTNIEQIRRLPEGDIARISSHYGPHATREMIIRRIKDNLILKEELYERVKNARLVKPGRRAA
ncbi:hypothetical protein HYW17_02510 [Candidatus Uhrbacteria bacterium]|nr:hypothetical protein [Candidatus Uhrbacteria bacterium]